MVGEEIFKKLNKEIRESRIYMNHIQLNNVELQIVQFLFEHEKQFVPSKEIAQKADVSDKTIRKYIKSLNNLLKDFGASIEMKLRKRPLKIQFFLALMPTVNTLC